MKKAKQPRTSWELSRLRTMPEAVYFEAILVLVGRRRVSRVARALLAVPDRGGLQSATFETLRTYLTSPHRILQEWLKSSPKLGPAPEFFLEAQNWKNIQLATKNQ
jgi:hypothetical protein